MPFTNIHTHWLEHGLEVFQIINPNIRETDYLDKLLNTKYIHLSLGIHPWYIEEDKIISQIDFIRSLINTERVLMIGESGLDHLCKTDMNLQMQVFEKMIELSEEYSKPLIIHNVKATSELIKFHKNFNPMQPWIIHGFRGNINLLNTLIDNGFYVSYGSVYNKESLLATPIKRMFIETDESRNCIKDVYKTISKDREIEISLLKDQMQINFKTIIPDIKIGRGIL